MQNRLLCHVRSVLPALITMCCIPAFAHHSPGAFDMTKQETLEGVITEVSWRNPHVYLTVETTGTGGQKQMQEIEAAAASSLAAYGVKPENLAVGERVSLKVSPHRQGAGHEVLGLTLTRQDGEVLALRAGVIPPPAPQAAATSLAGTWVPDASDFTALAQASQTWPLTEVGKRAAADVQARAKAAADCTPFGVPVLMAMPVVTVVEVLDDRIVFGIDGDGYTREVHLTNEVPVSTRRAITGYSVAHWEGDTLIVETTSFLPDPEGLGFALPSSPEKHVLEKFTLSADKRSLKYEATLTDPQYLTAPVNISVNWAYRPELQPSGEACDLESAQRFQTQ